MRQAGIFLNGELQSSLNKTSQNIGEVASAVAILRVVSIVDATSEREMVTSTSSYYLRQLPFCSKKGTEIITALVLYSTSLRFDT